MKSRFRNPHDGKYRQHSQVHKSKKKYSRKVKRKDDIESLIEDGKVKPGTTRLYVGLEVAKNLIEMYGKESVLSPDPNIKLIFSPEAQEYIDQLKSEEE